MAKAKTRSRRQKRARRAANTGIRISRRVVREVGAFVLVVLALVSLLALLTPDAAAGVALWRDFLETMLGWGIFFAPALLLLGALLLWMKTIPTATQTPKRPVYMRRADVTICPHARLRASRSGADDSHCVRDAAQKSRRTAAAKNAATPSGFRLIRTSSVEPIATASQKTVVAAGPNASPAGTAYAPSRHVVSAQAIGCVHCVLSFGPVGPAARSRASATKSDP